MTLTAQEIFDTSTRAIITQGGSSTRLTSFGDSLCAYRGADGRRCAAGIFIPDERYPEFLKENGEEDGSIAYSTNVRDLFSELVGADNIELLVYLQKAHDNYLNRMSDPDNWAAWKSRLFSIAINYNLNRGVLKEIPNVGSAENL